MRKIYIVSYEGDMEIAFENLADAQEYILYESYLEAIGWLHNSTESAIKRRLEMWENPYLCLMLLESRHFFIDEVVVY